MPDPAPPVVIVPDPPPPDQPPKPLLPVQPADGPAGGGWAPKPGTIVAVAVFLGVAGAVSPVLAAPGELNWRVLIASALTGAVMSLGSYLGLRSAGSRAP